MHVIFCKFKANGHFAEGVVTFENRNFLYWEYIFFTLSILFCIQFFLRVAIMSKCSEVNGGFVLQ